MKRNRKQVLEYQVVFEQEKEGGFSAWVPSLPGCASQGETFEAALANIKEAILLYLEDTKVEPDEVGKRQFVIPVGVQYA